MITYDTISKMRTDFAKLSSTVNEVFILVHKHESLIKEKLVDQQLMRDTIKNYLHDFEILMRNDQNKAVSELQTNMRGLCSLEVIEEKLRIAKANK